MNKFQLALTYKDKFIMSMKFKILFAQLFEKQFDAENPMSKLISKRKKVPHKALHMWNCNMMHQKDIFFSEPFVHGKILCSIQLSLFFYAYASNEMCTNQHNTYTLLQECVLTYKTPTRLSSLEIWVLHSKVLMV
jgi:hypothetical protein